MSDFFISYNSADSAWAEWISWELERVGYTTLIQSWDFRPGANFILEMHKAQRQAERTIAIISPSSLASNFTNPEWTAAFSYNPIKEGSNLLPIRVRECSADELLGSIAYIDLVGLDEEKARIKLLQGLVATRAKPKRKPAFPTSTESAQATRPRFPLSLAPLWNVPYQRNPYFTGRKASFSKLRHLLTSDRSETSICAIVGLGGIGKTQLAIEYAYRFATEYDVIAWFHANDPVTLTDDYKKLTRLLALPVEDPPKLSSMSACLTHWLESNGNWLLIYDDANTLENLLEVLPRRPKGHILITSRNTDWGKKTNVLLADTFTRTESVEFLLRNTEETNEKKASEVAAALGDLPLALAMAVGYIKSSQISLSEYLGSITASFNEVLTKTTPFTGYQKSIAFIFSKSLDDLRDSAPTAGDLLDLCAFFAPNDISIDLLTEGIDYLPDSLRLALQNTTGLNAAIDTLKRHSFIKTSVGSFSVHQLVQAIAREQMTEDKKTTFAKAAVQIVNHIFPLDSDDVQTWDKCARLMPHALIATKHAESLGASPSETSRLLSQVGLYLFSRSEFGEAKTFFDRALKIAEVNYGSNHYTVASILNNLGGVFEELGDIEGARSYYERALAIDEAAYGPLWA